MLRWLCLVGMIGGCMRPAAETPSEHQDELNRLIDQALHAKGDLAQWRRLPALTWKIKGTIYSGDHKAVYTGSGGSQGPNHSWTHLRFEVRGQSHDLRTVLNGDRYWETDNGQKLALTAEDVAHSKQEERIEYVISLVPLLDRSLPMKYLGEQQVDGRAVLAMEIKADENVPVKLFFDKQTGLLVKSENLEKDRFTGQEVLREDFYSAYQKVQGIQFATKSWTRKGGKKWAERECSDPHPQEKLDEESLTEPP